MRLFYGNRHFFQGICYFFLYYFFNWNRIYIFADQNLREMSGLFIIPISGSKEGRLTFNFEACNEFFERFEESEVKVGSLSVIIEMDRRSSHFDLLVKINGMVRLCCDRCLGMFDYPVKSESRLLVKLGKVWDESDPDIITIPASENELDMNQYIYEYVQLSLPIRRVHPRDEKGNSTCDPVMLGKLKEHIIDEEKKIDPRWNELKKLMNDN